MPNNTLQLFANDAPFKVIVEPWACPEFEVQPHDKCAVVAHRPTILPTFGCGIHGDQLTVWINEGGCTFSFTRNGVVEFAVQERLASPSF